jgi:hypothetical protein
LSAGAVVIQVKNFISFYLHELNKAQGQCKNSKSELLSTIETRNIIQEYLARFSNHSLYRPDDFVEPLAPWIFSIGRQHCKKLTHFIVTW